MTLGGFPGGIYGGIGQLGARAQAGPLPWYLSGGIAAGNCMAAYAPKGAASAAAALVNLVTPGTYDLTVAKDLDVPFAWDATNGFKLNYDALATGIDMSGTNKQWSIVMRFSNASNVCILFGIQNEYTVNFNKTGSSSAYNSGPAAAGKTLPSWVDSGVISIAGNKLYLDAAEVGTFLAGANITMTNFALGGRYNTNGTWDVVSRLYIQAAAMYNTPITAAQVAAVSAAMAAL